MTTALMGPSHGEVNMQRDCLASFLLGGLVGAGITLLFAPRSGREIRGLIGDRVRESGVRGRELKERVVQKGRDLVDDASDFVERQRQEMQWRKDRLAAAVEAGRDAYREEKSQA
jgi:gas vesicle protein